MAVAFKSQVLEKKDEFLFVFLATRPTFSWTHFSADMFKLSILDK